MQKLLYFPLGFQIQRTLWSMQQSKVVESSFDVDYLWKKENAAQHWLLVLQPFSVGAAAESRQGSYESEKWDSMSIWKGEHSVLCAVSRLLGEGALQEHLFFSSIKPGQIAMFSAQSFPVGSTSVHITASGRLKIPKDVTMDTCSIHAEKQQSWVPSTGFYNVQMTEGKKWISRA